MIHCLKDLIINRTDVCGCTSRSVFNMIASPLLTNYKSIYLSIFFLFGIHPLKNIKLDVPDSFNP
jgi:hypothetical protein